METNHFLSIVICFGYIIAPLLSNHFFLKNSKSYQWVHILSLIAVLISISGFQKMFSIVWFFFCGYGLYLYLHLHKTDLFQNKHWLGTIPFFFSLVSATWIVSGTNDFRLLGYDETWSYYAAIHGCFIGWYLLSGLCFLAIKHNHMNLLIVFIGMIVSFFFLIAIGIYQFGLFKKIGVIGYVVLFPTLVLYLYRVMDPKHNLSKIFLGISGFAVLISLGLAFGNEFFPSAPIYHIHQSNMVFVHGGINAFLVIPLLLGAILNEERNRIDS